MDGAMTPGLASALMPLMRALDAEAAHGVALRALAAGLAGRDAAPDDPVLATTAFGLDFRNPVGLAAGFDKDGVAVLPLMRLGFGLVEAGTVTPRPQPGNPRPRLFRLEEDRAVVNRMGFNNGGLEAFLARLAALRGAHRAVRDGVPSRPLPAVLGANIGVNKEGAAPERDYPALYAAVAPFADYVALNVSSPNTPGLRDLQGEDRLAAILDAVAAARAGLAGRAPPLLVKIAPDLAEEALGPIVEACAARGVAGLIVSNTTVARPDTLRSRHRGEAGGLSGAPLRERSTAVLRACFRLARGRGMALVGVGGVASGAEAYAKIRAGASLVQIYTGFAYGGPALVPRIKRELAALLRRDGFARVAEAVGADAA
jgi:dihydroorotate dehydrogenase